MLLAERLEKRYEGQVVLSDISLHVQKGECLGVVGPNGSGKSTLLKLLVGEEKLDHGTIHLAGRELSHYTPKERARQVAVLSQAGVGAVPFTVEEIVQMGRHPYQGKWPWLQPEDLAIVEQVLEATHLVEKRNRLLTQLSGGERQRVALAQVMAQDPQLLVLDEPTTYLDIQYQLAMLDLLHHWQRERQLTLIIVLHDLNLAAQYCDRLLLLKEGKMVTLGTPEDVIQPHWIEQVYGIMPHIIPHPERAVPQILLPWHGVK